MQMQQRYLGQIEPGMDVCDLAGEKLGTVAQVHRYDPAVVGGGREEGTVPRAELIEVKSGFLGLGKHLYVPLSAVRDVTQGCVFLSKLGQEIDQTDWYDKPPHLDELR